MAQIELQEIDAGTIGQVFWFRENRKSVILLGHPGEIPLFARKFLAQLIGSLRHEVGTAAVIWPTTDQ